MPVDMPCGDYTDWIDEVLQCRHVSGGKRILQRHGETYLPRISGKKSDPEKEEKARAAYALYLRYAPFHNATGLTIKGYLGLLFRKPGILEFPSAIQPIVDDVTGSNTPFWTFAKLYMQQRVTTKYAGILVDYPQAVEGVNIVTQPQADEFGLRTYWSMYRRESIINWQKRRVGARKQLVRVVLAEWGESVVDKFTSLQIPRYRVLELDDDGWYRQEIWQRTSGTTGDFTVVKTIYPLNNEQKMRHIPFACSALLEDGMEPPPVSDLVEQNLTWYRHAANLEHGLLWLANPQPWITGHDPKDTAELTWGARAALILKSDKARVGIAEVSGNFQAYFTALDRDEARMAMHGTRMLAPEKKDAESAETAAQHARGESSILATEAADGSAELTQALKWTVEWEGAEGKDPKCAINTDFFPVPMTPQMLAALVKGWQDGAYAREDLHRSLQRGEVIDPDRTLEDVLADVEGEKEDARMNAGALPDLPASEIDPNAPPPPPQPVPPKKPAVKRPRNVPPNS